MKHDGAAALPGDQGLTRRAHKDPPYGLSLRVPEFSHPVPGDDPPSPFSDRGVTRCPLQWQNSFQLRAGVANVIYRGHLPLHSFAASFADKASPSRDTETASLGCQSPQGSRTRGIW